MALKRFDQRTERSIARKEHDLINMIRELHRIDCKLDVYVALQFAMAAGVDELHCRLGHDREAIVVKPIEERPDGRKFVFLHDRRVEKGANQHAPASKFEEQPLEVGVEAERLGSRKRIRAIDKKGYFSVPTAHSIALYFYGRLCRVSDTLPTIHDGKGHPRAAETIFNRVGRGTLLAAFFILRPRQFNSIRLILDDFQTNWAGACPNADAAYQAFRPITDHRRALAAAAPTIWFAAEPAQPPAVAENTGRPMIARAAFEFWLAALAFMKS
jgi:hypothetical protein